MIETMSDNTLLLKETIKLNILRANGVVEDLDAIDLIVTTGRNYIAQRIAAGDSVNSAMAYTAVGTVSTAASLNNTTLTGEVKRKGTCINSTYSAANVFSAVSTYGGAADSISSLALVEAGVFNHASSGQGTMMQRVTFSSVTLADSDVLRIELQTNVGSS